MNGLYQDQRLVNRVYRRLLRIYRIARRFNDW